MKQVVTPLTLLTDGPTYVIDKGLAKRFHNLRVDKPKRPGRLITLTHAIVPIAKQKRGARPSRGRGGRGTLVL